MQQSFNFFNENEVPYFILCNPDKTELYSLSLAYDTNIIQRFNALSDFKFKFPKSIDGGTTSIEAYDYLNNKRLVKIENYGYFIITNVQENSEGAVPIKEVSCQSLESELIQKRVTAFGGTKPLWNILTPGDITMPDGSHISSILYDMIQLAPNWSVGDIDSSLLTLYRTFNVSDTNIYNFLMNDVAKAFDCVFIFDTETRTISAKAVSTSTTTSDIFLSFDNLIMSSSFSEKSDEIVTCLAVYGGGDLNIRPVNPLGTDKIYDFSYYKTIDWMSQGLIDAITLWESNITDFIDGTNVNGHNPSSFKYANLLTLLRGYNLELILLKSDLVQLQTDYTVLETTKKARIEANLSYADINSQLASKQLEISAKQTAIVNKQAQIDLITSELVFINGVVSFEENFTPEQLLELDNFIYQNTFKDENIIQTDLMNDVEIQDAQQDLYNQAVAVLAKVSQPRYEIEISSVNFVALSDFSVFTSQLELGTTITCEVNPDEIIETVLLQIEMTFDKPDNFSILLSNRVRKDGSGFVYSDLMGQVVKTGASVAFDNYKWSNWESTYKDDVSTFITSSLNTANNNLINNSNQEILIDSNGLRGRTYDTTTSTYKPTQVWLTSSILAFSDDGFATSKLALGAVSTSAGTKYGLVAEVIVGNLIAGNTLTITNTRTDGTPSNFTLNQLGATLYNAQFTITNNNSRILLNPNDTDGRIFRIQKNEATVWTDKFWVDNVGNVNFSGNLSGATGTFSGNLSAATGTFAGTIYADKLDPSVKVSYNQLTDIPAEKITSGQMSSSRLGYGYPAGNVGAGDMNSVRLKYGSAFIGNGTSSGSLYLEAPSGTTVSGNLTVTNNGTIYGGLNVSGSITMLGVNVATQNYVNSRGFITGTTGTTVTGLKLKTGYSGSASYANMNFQDGLLKGFTYSST